MGIGDAKPTMRVYKEPKQFFDAWLEAGTLELAAKLLSNRGIRNKKGEAIQWFTVLYQANKWMVENPEETRKALIANDPVYWRFEDDGNWADFIVLRAHKVLNEKQFFRWITRYGYLEYAKNHKLVPQNYGENRI